jgi:hypothetical protein
MQEADSCSPIAKQRSPRAASSLLVVVQLASVLKGDEDDRFARGKQERRDAHERRTCLAYGRRCWVLPVDGEYRHGVCSRL